MGDVMFVFKDVSYYMENESRLIITRDINDFDDIKKLIKLHLNFL